MKKIKKDITKYITFSLKTDGKKLKRTKIKKKQ